MGFFSCLLFLLLLRLTVILLLIFFVCLGVLRANGSVRILTCVLLAIHKLLHERYFP